MTIDMERASGRFAQTAAKSPAPLGFLP
jgi:hypothetical protein